MSDHPPGGEAHISETIARPRFEVADILRMARDHGHIDLQGLTPARSKVLHAICRCRTAELGGHAEVCADCGNVAISYNSCRNRHCPRCQWSAQERWIAGRLERLLDTHYFHVVFTLPAALRPLAACNPRQIYGLLFKAGSRTLHELGRDPKRLGADLGITAVLHTWTRDLRLHPHLHCLVTGGGLSLDGSTWKSAREHYLFPVRVMGALFRGKFLAGLRALRDRDELVGVDDDTKFDALVDRLYRKNWVVYAKRPMTGPEQVITYLGRYTHRVAISNSRILGVRKASVTFRTRGEEKETLTLEEFARRFLLHVLPKGFVKIRHYGLFAAANVHTKWVLAASLRPASIQPKGAEQEIPAVCEICGSTRLFHVELAPEEVLVTASNRPRGPPHPLNRGATP